MRSLLEAALATDARAWLDAALAEAEQTPARAIPERFPALARKIGTAALGTGREIERPAGGKTAYVDRAAWRRADAAALLLLRAGRAGDDLLIDLYLHGDFDERISVLRALALLPIGAATLRLLEEVQRTNMQPHFEAAICDSNLLARAHEHLEFGAERFNRMMLKAAFLDVPLGRLYDAGIGANRELSRMLQDLASEREAAGRAVWADTCRLIASAPAPGTAARIIGGLEHGDDRQRLAAAEGLALLGRPDLAPFARERLDREPRPAIRAVLESLLRNA